MGVLGDATWGAALVAFVGGVVSFFSPCVAPLVPGYIGYLSGGYLSSPALDTTATAKQPPTDASSQTTWARVLPVCLLFVAGFSVALVGVGLLMATAGRLLAAYSLVLQTVAGIVMVVMGAFLLNLLPRGLTTTLLREKRLYLDQTALRRLGPLRRIAPFALGVVFAAGWTPCIGPVLASILLYVGANASRGLGVTLLACYALGFALPFLAVGLGWSFSLRALGWLRRHGQAVSMVTGVALVLVGIVYLSGQASIFAVWAQQVAIPTLR
ncbi:MAG: cytochrome c biogenesis CcdA family protein [Ktedonobacterales bacterium]